MATIITLIAQTFSIDQYGNEVVTTQDTDVFAEVDSVSQSEFFAAQDTELKPEYKFTVFFGNYNGQSLVEYEDEIYSVYRTYRTGDNLELYVERKIGERRVVE